MRIIAYYLPQFHVINENNEWWGDGFTEWTSVKNALPLYKGHEQPKVPGDLGYYNLLEPDVRKSQADLAKDNGIEGFCYWHYWFGNGKRLLEKPINAVLESGEPNFPFCFGWANESWKAKVWGEKGKSDKLLIEQKYPGKKDVIDHFYANLAAFKDSRYIRVEGKPIFLIYKPLALPKQQQFIAVWQELALKEDLKGIFFVGHANRSDEIQDMLDLGFNAVNIVRNGEWLHNKRFLYRNILSLIQYKLLNKPYIIAYKKIIKLFTKPEDSRLNIYPTLIPNWDHTPRSAKKGYLYHGSTPELFKEHINTVLESVKNKPLEHQIIFLKSWNEWGEGNYIEPDSKYGKSYLNTLKSALANFSIKKAN